MRHETWFTSNSQQETRTLWNMKITDNQLQQSTEGDRVPVERTTFSEWPLHSAFSIFVLFRVSTQEMPPFRFSSYSVDLDRRSDWRLVNQIIIRDPRGLSAAGLQDIANTSMSLLWVQQSFILYRLPLGTSLRSPVHLAPLKMSSVAATGRLKARRCSYSLDLKSNCRNGTQTQLFCI